VPDESTQAEGSEGTEVEGKTPVEAPAAEGAGSGSGSEEDVVSREAFKKVQSEAKSLRTRLKETEARVAEFESQGKSAEEKMKTELEKSRTEIERLSVANRSLMVAAVAPMVNIVDPLAAAKLVDWSTVEDVTDPEQVRAALNDVAKAHPALVRESGGGIDGGAGARRGRPQKLSDMNAVIRRQAAGRR
jgi:hypothetical protein